MGRRSRRISLEVGGLEDGMCGGRERRRGRCGRMGRDRRVILEGLGESLGVGGRGESGLGVLGT